MTALDAPFHSNAHDDRAEAGTEPGLLVSVVLFQFRHGRLHVGCLAPSPDQLRLPSGVPRRDESLDSAARRIIQEYAATPEQYLEQLYTFSQTADCRRQVIVSYIALFQPSTPVATAPATLVWRHVDDTVVADDIERVVLDYAVFRLRAKLGYTNVAFYLLPETFTLSELQHVYERVLGHAVDKRNFRRRMSTTGMLVQTDEKRRDVSHRPAALYRFVARDDHAAFLTPPWALQRTGPEPADEEPSRMTESA